MEEKQATHLVEKIIGQILLERKLYERARKVDGNSPETNTAQNRIHQLIKELQELFSEQKRPVHAP